MPAMKRRRRAGEQRRRPARPSAAGSPAIRPRSRPAGARRRRPRRGSRRARPRCVARPAPRGTRSRPGSAAPAARARGRTRHRDHLAEPVRFQPGGEVPEGQHGVELALPQLGVQQRRRAVGHARRRSARSMPASCARPPATAARICRAGRRRRRAAGPRGRRARARGPGRHHQRAAGAGERREAQRRAGRALAGGEEPVRHDDVGGLRHQGDAAGVVVGQRAPSPARSRAPGRARAARMTSATHCTVPNCSTPSRTGAACRRGPARRHGGERTRPGRRAAAGSSVSAPECFMARYAVCGSHCDAGAPGWQGLLGGELGEGRPGRCPGPARGRWPPGPRYLDSCYEGGEAVNRFTASPPSHNNCLKVMGSKGLSALGGVQGQSPWPYFLCAVHTAAGDRPGMARMRCVWSRRAQSCRW